LLEKFISDIEHARDIVKDNNTDAVKSIKNAEKFTEWLKGKGAITANEQRKKIESKLDGLTPKEVLELVKKK